MNERRDNEQPEQNQPLKDTPTAFQVVSEYVAALAARDSEQMRSLHAPDFVLDWVYGDAFENPPRSAKETHEFFPSWFIGFPDLDYEVRRTIAAEKIVVTEWTFTGANSGPLAPPVFEHRREPTGRTIQFRGVSIYDVDAGFIRRETIYLDLATLVVELGVVL